jgi:hypothetical protein
VYAEEHGDEGDGENTLEIRLLGPPRPGPSRPERR